jgi:hypothetical protein
VGAEFLREIDWSRPWLQAFLAAAEPVSAADDWRSALNAAAAEKNLRNHRGLPLCFVPQTALPEGVAYESFISASGGVPTRDNLHDFFNALAWLTFPQIKRRLNALQAAEIESAGGVATRSKPRDAATIFDENAVLLVTCDLSWLADLREHRWHRALFESRARFDRSVEVLPFGHALLEKLTAPYKAITAHAWAVPVDAEFFSLPLPQRVQELDAAVAAQLSSSLATKDFTPLPVLGVPGWWQEQDAAFYADSAVFRPKRQA